MHPDIIPTIEFTGIIAVASMKKDEIASASDLILWLIYAYTESFPYNISLSDK